MTSFSCLIFSVTNKYYNKKFVLRLIIFDCFLFIKDKRHKVFWDHKQIEYNLFFIVIKF